MKATVSTLTKKDGNLTAMHQEAFNKIIKSKGKVYVNQWIVSGRRQNLRSIESYVMDFANAFGFKVVTGNDAVRGGAEGKFVKFSAKAVKSLSEKFN